MPSWKNDFPSGTWGEEGNGYNASFRVSFISQQYEFSGERGREMEVDGGDGIRVRTAMCLRRSDST